jgi:hypothetical protein
MAMQRTNGRPVWREDAAIWEIVAGEMVAQRYEPVAEASPEALTERASVLGLRAREMVSEGDFDAAGHALIGCSVTLGLAALRSEATDRVSVESFAAELAATVSWGAEAPTQDSLLKLTDEIAAASDPSQEGPTIWELAVRAGAAAAGLSPYIKRRRESRSGFAPAA